MKHLKSYENISNEEINVGDYVICTEKTDSMIPNYLKDYFSENIGMCVPITEFSQEKKDRLELFKIVFDTNLTKDIKAYLNGTNYRFFSRHEIRKATPEEIENFLIQKNIKKYNL
jgi:predicted restriction endonuclease